jgi:hypothetical protein
MASDSTKVICKPGDRVQKPGIYKVIHDDHRRPHEASFRFNDVFPSCKVCGSRVRFELRTYAQEAGTAAAER